jgi:alkanesulfonate monooxygenase SsuD/methylene tetrahydromethanopterin reductase-like flavin-dependent oxidoreductase (luciferase family)
MLRLTGRVGDGWLPSLGYLPEGTASLREMNAQIDEGAERAGRDPAVVRRLLNVSGQFASSRRGLLVGLPTQWAEELAEMTLTYGVSGFILASDDVYSTEMFAAEVAPATREIVAGERVGSVAGVKTD